MSVLGIWNKALSVVNARGRLTSLTDRTPEQEVCSQWYSLVRDTTQAAAWWPSCKTLARLALLDEAEDEWQDGEPEPGYSYAYALPENYLHPWHLSDYSRFSLSFSPTLNRTILSANTENAILVYARRNDDPSSWTTGLVESVAYALAAKIAGPLTGRNSSIQSSFQQLRLIIDEERAKVANTTEPDPRPAVPWLAARGVYGYSAQRFYYPFGSLNGLSADAG